MRLDMDLLTRAYVLLSGGIDSTTCLYRAKNHMDKVGGKVKAYSMNYGQRHVKEIGCAENICKDLGVDFEVLDITGFAEGMLTDPSREIPDVSYAAIDGISPTYIPFRNGFMLSRLAAEAQSYVNSVVASKGIDPMSPDLEELVWLYFGAHMEDSENWAYPDCSPEFIGSMSNAIYIGTYRTVRLLTPFTFSSKAEIIRQGQLLGVPYEKTYSCYAGGTIHCGICPTCRARKQAFSVANVMDPTDYACISNNKSLGSSRKSA